MFVSINATLPRAGRVHPVERDPWPSTYDRDLDVPRRHPRVPSDAIGPYRRMVVNPLLAVVCFAGAIQLLRAALFWRTLTAFLTALGLLGVSVCLTQCHCLDCGTTTWLFASRRHACEPALSRWREGRRGRWPFPGLKLQVVLWLYVLASVATLLLILYRFGHA
jgi:hypothetical protein